MYCRHLDPLFLEMKQIYFIFSIQVFHQKGAKKLEVLKMKRCLSFSCWFFVYWFIFYFFKSDLHSFKVKLKNNEIYLLFSSVQSLHDSLVFVFFHSFDLFFLLLLFLFYESDPGERALLISCHSSRRQITHDILLMKLFTLECSWYPNSTYAERHVPYVVLNMWIIWFCLFLFSLISKSLCGDRSAEFHSFKIRLTLLEILDCKPRANTFYNDML